MDTISKQDKRAVVNLIDDINATSFYEANERSKECYYDIRNAILAMPERESILDKIRAEIAHLTITKGGEDYTRKMAELYSLKIKVLQIIDKYKAESEEQDDK